MSRDLLTLASCGRCVSACVYLSKYCRAQDAIEEVYHPSKYDPNLDFSHTFHPPVLNFIPSNDVQGVIK